ncbi:MAG: penicillin acylase family protein [bacterium]|nr:penicillin acylase family protein [bacterium]
MIRTWLQGTVGLIVTLAVLIVCFAVFAVRIATRSHPVPYTENSVGVKDTARVYRNSFGIPHIVASSEDDLFFAQGFAHAQDRLWQMDMWRRAGRGTLAEVLGRDLVDTDLYMRAVDIPAIARMQLTSMQPTSKRILKSYAAGVNAFIDAKANNLPFEFDALDYVPSRWTEEDCLIIGRVFAFELSVGFISDLTFSQIAAQRGQTSARTYIPTPASAPYVLDTSSTRVTPESTTVDSTTAAIDASLLHNLTKGLSAARTRLGMEANGIGSNCWAVRTGLKGAIVANDPHLGVSMPPKWYQVHLTAPGLNVLGMSIPGMPLVFSGRNDFLAWGFTNVMADDVDYVLERVDSSNANYYIGAEGKRTRFTYRRDTIVIKDAQDSLIDLRFTNHGCVISDVHLLRNPSAMFGIVRQRASSLLSQNCLTFQWTARYTSDEILALYKLNIANTFTQAVDALGTWYAPALNVSIGTKDGKIGTVLAGVIPNRGSADPHFFITGWESTTDWKGVTNLRTLGTLVNPARGFVASANNRTSASNTPFITSLYHSPSRIKRIQDQLRIYHDYSVRDAQVMQQDVTSPYAQEFLDKTLAVLQRGESRFGSQEREALALLRRWDGTQSPVEPAASVFAAFFQRMVWNTFEDELGEQLFYEYMYVSSIPTQRLMDLLDEPQHPLFDDARTLLREDMAWIAIRSFVEAVRELRTTFQSDQSSNWRYGTIHTITLSHQLGMYPLMRPVMNQGPFEIGGSGTTINNTEWRMYKPYAVSVAAAMRVISDVRDTVQYSVVPGGVSGQPLDAHYADQVQLWLKGGYVRLPCSAVPDVSFRLYEVLVP